MSVPVRIRRTLIAGLVVGGGLVAAPPASAAESVTPNACHYLADGYWRDLSLRFVGAAAPVYVPPGAAFRLGNTAIAAALPDWITEYGFNLGLLKAGYNRIPADVWVAVAGNGSAQGAQTVRATVQAETTITTDATGELYKGATPLNVIVPLSDTTWTAPREHAARVTFQQAPSGSLPAIPGTNGGAAYAPKGSVFIRAQLNNSTVFDLDCQPGRAIQNGDAFTGGGASPFEYAYADEGAAPTGIDVPLVPSPPVTLQTTKPRTSKSRKQLSLKVANGGLIDAAGQIQILTSGKHRIGKAKKAKTVTAVPWTTYSVASRKSRTLKLTLSRDLQSLLKQRKSVKVRVSLRAESGRQTAAGDPRYLKAVRTTVTLRRG